MQQAMHRYMSDVKMWQVPVYRVVCTCSIFTFVYLHFVTSAGTQQPASAKHAMQVWHALAASSRHCVDVSAHYEGAVLLKYHSRIRNNDSPTFQM